MKQSRFYRNNNNNNTIRPLPRMAWLSGYDTLSAWDLRTDCDPAEAKIPSNRTCSVRKVYASVFPSASERAVSWKRRLLVWIRCLHQQTFSNRPPSTWWHLAGPVKKVLHFPNRLRLPTLDVTRITKTPTRWIQVRNDQKNPIKKNAVKLLLLDFFWRASFVP